jgi:hypothetical protein
VTARILPRMSAAEYHRDPCAVPSLSSSCAATLLSKSPYHAWLGHPKLGGVQREATEEMNAGSLMHAIVLGQTDEIEIIEAENFRTKAAQEARDKAHAAHRVPVLRATYEDAEALAAEVTAALTALGMPLPGESEVSIEWTEDTHLGPVVCRCRMDHLWLDAGIVLDLKSCRSAHPRAIQSHCYEFGYDVQRAAYTSALRQLRPECAGRERFMFLFVEALPEGSKRRAICQPVELDGSFRALGVKRWARACETWAECLKSGRWPAYSDHEGDSMFVDAPGWALAQEGV